MARDHARIRCAIWRDDEFTSLTPNAQRIYMLLLSQPKLSMCGALDYTPDRWSKLAKGDTVEAVEDGIYELEDGDYLVVDLNTSELVIRSFVKHDGVCDSPNLIQAMWKAWAGVFSKVLRSAVVHELPDHAFTTGFGTEKKGYEPPSEALALREIEPLSNPSAKGSRKGSPTPVTGTTPDPEPSSSTGAHAERVQAAAELLAQHDYDRLREDKPDHHVGDVPAWLASAGRRRLNLDGERLRAIAEEHPDWTAEEIAAEMTTPGANPTGFDEAQRAQAAVMERNHLRLAGAFRCEACEDMGVVELDDGTFTDCECKARRSA